MARPTHIFDIFHKLWPLTGLEVHFMCPDHHFRERERVVERERKVGERERWERKRKMGEREREEKDGERERVRKKGEREG